VFCGTRISTRMSRDNAGNLICHGAVIARSGFQQYTGRELGMDSDEIIEVWRSPAEVTSNATIASCEGKLVTDHHPGSFLGTHNSGLYARGHVQNVREGPPLADGNRCLVADLVVHDDSLISKILDGGLREISLGYDTDYVEREGGTLEQTNIRVNHLALVGSGRCGAACRVRDHKEQQPMTKDERKQLAEAMELVRELTEAFRDRQQVEDCGTKPTDDRAFGERAKEFHRGGKPKAEVQRPTKANDSVESWAEAMNSYGRRMREGKK
jgi:hypothetical protein